MDTGPEMLPLDPSLVKDVTIRGAERVPGFVSVWAGFMLFYVGIMGNWGALWGLPFILGWHGLWVLAYKRDPKYFTILWRKWLIYRWPQRMGIWPGVQAKAVKIEPSVPVRG